MNSDKFTNPFRYVPSPQVKLAASSLTEEIDSNPLLKEIFSEGKMLGVLVVDADGDEPLLRRAVAKDGRTVSYLAGFSGLAGGSNMVEGFVPPIFDLLDPEGHFKKEEARIVGMNRRIAELENGEGLLQAKARVSDLEILMDKEVARMKADLRQAKERRDMERAAGNVDEDALMRESQFGKAELRRATRKWKAEIETARKTLDELEGALAILKEERKKASEELQKWLFERYIVYNAEGGQSSIGEIFAKRGLVPPGGTGECAAPKLLQYAYSHKYKPLSIGEFWYGKDASGNRVNGRFYPACHSKCGPLLGYMLRGMVLEDDDETIPSPEIIYEDEALVVALKPYGMLCVPGKTGEKSLMEILSEQIGCPLFEVHRLDMDTSGIVVFAKTAQVQVSLRKQFEERSVSKEYMARLKGRTSAAECGRISIPLAPDMEDRPRQKVDYENGKEAVTLYRLEGSPDGENTDVTFIPLTGRTHQLRVHAAHKDGLGCPIKGDRLYGGAENEKDRLHLHAAYLSFIHPLTKEKISFRSDEPSY